MDHARSTGTWSRKAVAFAASAVLALQAVLLTLAPPAVTPAADAVHAPHEHDAHHAARHDDAPDQPADAPSHHRGLCCILGSKLGTALGTIETSAAASVPMAFRLVVRPLLTTVGVAAPRQSGALGARAPPSLAV